MINFYNLLLEVGDTRVTDFNEGSEIRNLLETYAVDSYSIQEDQYNLSKIAFIETAEGEWLDKHGALPQINLPRETGTVATGYVTFTLPSASETQVIIPTETLLTCTENDLDYATDSDVIIGVGETSAMVSVSCISEGYDGNCSENTLTIISDDYINIQGLTVTNTSPLTGGTDYEEDDAYRERLLNFVQRASFGSYDYYNDLGNSVDGVHDILLDDPTGTETAHILINGDEKPTPNTVISDVIEAFTIPSNIVLGHNFTYDKPNYLETKLKVTCTVAEEISTTDITKLLTALFDGGGPLDGLELEGLYIGETLTKDSMDTTLELLDDMISFTVEVKYKNNGTWDSDWATFTDKTPSDDEVLKLDDVTVVQTLQT